MARDYSALTRRSVAPRGLHAAAHDDSGAADGRVAAWTLLGIILFFKLGTAALILWYTRPASDAYAILIAFHWYLAVPLLLLLAGPALFWYRLMRARARREQLRRAEWDV
jgi:hypothetical protein